MNPEIVRAKIKESSRQFADFATEFQRLVDIEDRIKARQQKILEEIEAINAVVALKTCVYGGLSQKVLNALTLKLRDEHNVLSRYLDKALQYEKEKERK